MYKHILVPTDGSELSEQAVNYGVDLAKAVNANVTGITVSTPFHIFAVEPHVVTDTLRLVHGTHDCNVAANRLSYVKDVAAELVSVAMSYILSTSIPTEQLSTRRLPEDAT